MTTGIIILLIASIIGVYVGASLRKSNVARGFDGQLTPSIAVTPWQFKIWHRHGFLVFLRIIATVMCLIGAIKIGEETSFLIGIIAFAASVFIPAIIGVKIGGPIHREF